MRFFHILYRLESYLPLLFFNITLLEETNTQGHKLSEKKHPKTSALPCFQKITKTAYFKTWKR